MTNHNFKLYVMGDFLRGSRWHCWKHFQRRLVLCSVAATSQPHHILCRVSRAVQAINASMPWWQRATWPGLFRIQLLTTSSPGSAISTINSNNCSESRIKPQHLAKKIQLNIKNEKGNRPEQEAWEGLASSLPTPPVAQTAEARNP